MPTVIHLTGKGMSGRLVRYRVLTFPEVQHNETQVARGLTKDTTKAEYDAMLNDLGREQMVVAVSEPVTPEKRLEAKWRQVDPTTLTLEWNKLFTTRDTAALRMLYDREHTVTTSDIEAIMAGKVEELED
jgi:hypothetical protein